MNYMSDLLNDNSFKEKDEYDFSHILETTMLDSKKVNSENPSLEEYSKNLEKFCKKVCNYSDTNTYITRGCCDRINTLENGGKDFLGSEKLTNHQKEVLGIELINQQLYEDGVFERILVFENNYEKGNENLSLSDYLDRSFKVDGFGYSSLRSPNGKDLKRELQVGLQYKVRVNFEGEYDSLNRHIPYLITSPSQLWPFDISLTFGSSILHSLADIFIMGFFSLKSNTLILEKIYFVDIKSLKLKLLDVHLEENTETNIDGILINNSTSKLSIPLNHNFVKLIYSKESLNSYLDLSRFNDENIVCKNLNYNKPRTIFLNFEGPNFDKDDNKKIIIHRSTKGMNGEIDHYLYYPCERGSKKRVSHRGLGKFFILSKEGNKNIETLEYPEKHSFSKKQFINCPGESVDRKRQGLFFTIYSFNNKTVYLLIVEGKELGPSTKCLLELEVGETYSLSTIQDQETQKTILKLKKH